jgi:hypothetical protein
LNELCGGMNNLHHGFIPNDTFLKVIPSLQM